MMGRHPALRHLAVQHIRPEQQVGGGAALRCDGQDQRRACMPEPMFLAIDPVPVGSLMLLQ